MRIWIDLANSPHVPLMAPIVERLHNDGHEVILTARHHAQTVELAREAFADVRVVGGESPAHALRKGMAIARRALGLAALAAGEQPDVAFSHGSYAQVLGATLVGVPAVTMMDYEHQPANHLSFRLSCRIIVPEAFDPEALRRTGAPEHKVVRYAGFKEELYASRIGAKQSVLAELGLDPARVIVVMRPEPEGALYHRMANDRFGGLLAQALDEPDVQVVVLPRTERQRERLRSETPDAIVPDHAVDATSLLTHADILIGAGGTMTREAAVLGTPTYTIFAGKLAGVDAELIRQGRLHDLRSGDHELRFVKKKLPVQDQVRSSRTLDTVVRTILAVGQCRDARRSRAKLSLLQRSGRRRAAAARR